MLVDCVAPNTHTHLIMNVVKELLILRPHADYEGHKSCLLNRADHLIRLETFFGHHDRDPIFHHRC